MGNSSSQENQGSSSQQPHQPAEIHSEPGATIIPQQPSKTSTNSTTTTRINSNNNNEVKRERKEIVKLPHNCEAIIKDADSSIDKSSPEKLYEQLYAGIYLNGRRKKYWVEKKGNINCFMVFASGLLITWAENENYWYLHDVETSEGRISVAELRSVCWLEVHGKLHTGHLTPGVTYEVAYTIKLEYSSFGWEAPVNFRLTLPNGTKQEHKESLKEKTRGEWIRIPVGEFKASSEVMGEIEFSLYEYEGGSWKKGLVVKGASIEPKF